MPEEHFDQFDEALNKLSKLMESWEQRLTLDNLALTERYLKGELRVQVHLRHHILTASGKYPVDFCAIFQREPTFGYEEVRRHKVLVGSG